MIRRRARALLWLVACGLLVPVSPARGQLSRAVVIAEDKVNLRTGPGTSFPVETWVASREKVIPLEKVAGWTRVRTASGRVGFIHDSLLAYAAPDGAVVAATPPGGRTPRPAPTRPRMGRSMTPPAHQTVAVPAVSP